MLRIFFGYDAIGERLHRKHGKKRDHCDKPVRIGKFPRDGDNDPGRGKGAHWDRFGQSNAESVRPNVIKTLVAIKESKERSPERADI